MGKTTGFMDYSRKTSTDVPPLERMENFDEFHIWLSREEQQTQAARCMDCGVPFCQAGMMIGGMASGCPLNNLIPEWNDLVYHGKWELALHRLLATNRFPEFTSRVCPALCEAACTCGDVTGSSVTRSLLDSKFADGKAIDAKGKNVLVIGGGDTGNDCQGTALRQGCTDLVALEMMPQPPKERAASNPWPEWPRVLKVDYGQTECLAKFNKDPRIYQTTVKEFLKDDAGNLTGAVISYLKPERDPETGRTRMVPTGEEFTYDCQLAFIAAGFTGCESYVADAFGVDRTPRGNVADQNFKTNVDKVFVCGDMRRGQSLVVWGLREGRDCAAAVDRYLMGYTNL